MTWDAYHRRKNALREMLATAEQRPEITLTELLDTVDSARDAFASETEALFELQMTWFQRLAGHVDRLVAEGTESPELVAVTAWVNAAADLPGVRALLDAHRDEPALRKAYAKEQGYLALAAGVPVHGQEALARGRRIQDSARATVAAMPAEPAGPTRPGWMTRLKNVIAA
ncbi:MAG: hypothetical protein JWR55_1234 [Aeromicrobium sp.]|nr:hypothetical protein [Aeromicrobium sp.]